MPDQRSDERRLAVTAAQSEDRKASPSPDASLIADWLCFTPDNTVEVYTGKVEVGQNARTALAQAVADELRLPVDAIRMVMADTDRTPFDAGTFGSQTTPIMAPRLRAVAASARELLLDRAAERWQVERSCLTTSGGQVVDQQRARSLRYAELAALGSLAVPYDPHIAVTPADAWTVGGTSAPKTAGRAMVTGRHRYTSDLVRPGMWAGKVLRPPAIGATLCGLDTSAAEALPDVVVVRDGDFVGVVAPDRERATEALQSLRATWERPAPIEDDELWAYLRSHPAPPPDDPARAAAMRYAQGSVEQGRAIADLHLAQSYTHAYVAHAPLEPRAAVAEWNAECVTVWTGTQRPFGVRGELAAALGVAESCVRVIVPDTGGAFGGKHTGEAAIEAARLARAAGRPVKLIWTREEEFAWAYLRPGGVIDIASAAQRDGSIVAWEYDCWNGGVAGMRTPYAVPHQRIEFHPSESPLRQGSYRALAATANHFARESHMDELAHLLEQDPLQFRLRQLRDERLCAVLQAAAERFGWGDQRPGRGVGLACGAEKGSYVATCVEVEVDPGDGRLAIRRIVQAFECGAIVNPNGLRQQVEGALIQGLGGALWEAIRVEDGRIVTDQFSRYRVPRFEDVPPIEIVLLNRTDLPSAGAGETPIIGIAPALANAIFAATGIRLRSLPLTPSGCVPGTDRQASERD